MSRIVDLSMPVHADMLTFPRVPPPALAVYETHEQFAERIGAAEYGVDSLTASYLVVTDDHVGTHCDARKHIVPDAGGPETIPLECCISDGVLLDFTDRESGHGISAADIEAELEASTTRSRSATSSSSTPAPAHTTPRSATAPTIRGMSAEATRWLIERGVRMMGCDAITFDPPVWAMFEKQAVLGGAPGDVGRGVLAPREPDEPRPDRPPARLPARACCRSSGWARRPRRCAPWRSWRTNDGPAVRRRGLPRGRRGRRQGRLAGAHGGARAAGAARLRRASRRARAGARPTAARSCARRSPPTTAGAHEHRRRLRHPRPRLPKPWRRRTPRSATTRRSRCAPAPAPRTREDGHLRRPAGDLPARARSGRRARPRPRLLGVVLLRAGALLPRAEGLARRPRHGGGGAADGATRTSPACCSPATRCSGAATAWSSRRCSGSARPRVSGQVTPDHYVLKRDGTVKKERLSVQPFAIVAVRDGRHRRARAQRRGGRRAEARRGPAARAGRASATTSSSGSGGPQDIEWALEGGELYVLQARPVTA